MKNALRGVSSPIQQYCKLLCVSYRLNDHVDRLVGADINDPAVPTSPGGVPARLSTAASGGGGGIWRNDIVEN